MPDVDGLRVALMGSRGYPSTYGGFETLVRELAPRLRDWGAEVVVYGRDRPRGIRVHDGVVSVNTAGIDSKAASTLSYGAIASLHASRQRYDAALVLNVANGFYLPLLKARGIPTAVNVDGLEWLRSNWSGLGKQTFLQGAKLTARFGDELIFDSEQIGITWGEDFGRAGTFIPYGAEVVDDAGSDRLTEVGLDAERYVLVVARLVPENNIDLYLDAVRLLPEGIVPVLVGTAPAPCPLSERVEAAARSGAVTWLGHVRDQDLLRQLWSNALAYFHGHSAGGTNPALLQAMGAGSPTIAFDTRFNREVLTDAGTFVSDAAALAKEVERVASSPERRSANRDNGRHQVATRYQWDDVCTRYADVLSALAGSRARGTRGVLRG